MFSLFVPAGHCPAISQVRHVPEFIFQWLGRTNGKWRPKAPFQIVDKVRGHPSAAKAAMKRGVFSAQLKLRPFKAGLCQHPEMALEGAIPRFVLLRVRCVGVA
jgi:hypothetical protein